MSALKLELGKNFKYRQIDWIFLAYFAVMLAHSAVPYLKFILFFIVIFLTLYQITQRGIDRVSGRNMLMIFSWFGLFFIWVALSKIWSFVQKPDSDIISTMIRILLISLCIGYQVNNKIRFATMIDILIKAGTYFAIIYLATSPIETWGTIQMGGVTEQWRNFTGHFCAIMSLCAFIYRRVYGGRSYAIYGLILGLCTVLTGSRGALLSLAFMILISIVMQENVSKRLRNILFALVLIVIAIFVLFTNEYLYQIYGSRLVAIFSRNVTDLSADDRAMYIEIGFNMFLQKPLLGWGMDNFAYYLKFFCGYVKEVYSHCNYVEILSCYGLIGFIIYYIIYFKSTVSALRIRGKAKEDYYIKLCLIILLRFLVFEYSTITFSVYLYVYILATVFSGINLYMIDARI